MNPPMKPTAPGLPLSTGLGVMLGGGVGCRGVAVMDGGGLVGIGVGAGVGGGVGAGVGVIVGRGVAPDATMTVGPPMFAGFPFASALNVTGQFPTGRVVDAPKVPFEDVPDTKVIGTVRPAAEKVTLVAAAPS